MILSIQIYSFLYSFCYGVFFFILLEINYKIIYSENKYIKVIGTLVFILFNSLLYFIGLKSINNGIIHIYFLLTVLCGYFFSFFIYFKIWRK